jgi:hypothetical protein
LANHDVEIGRVSGAIVVFDVANLDVANATIAPALFLGFFFGLLVEFLGGFLEEKFDPSVK